MKLKWIKASDSFVIGREDLADLSDWATNIYNHHYKDYSEEDMIKLGEILEELNKILTKYIKDDEIEVHHKLKKIL